MGVVLRQNREGGSFGKKSRPCGTQWCERPGGVKGAEVSQAQSVVEEPGSGTDLWRL